LILLTNLLNLNLKKYNIEKMNEQPLVSILMTAYNREKYIAEAIESVLASTYQNWELIVVDDCSKDKSLEIARTYESKDKRIKVYLNEKNLGDYPNRNQAANYAQGKYIKYLDSDDIIYPHSLEIMINSMEKFPDAGMGLTFNDYSDEFKFPTVFVPEQVYKYHFYKNGLMYIGPSSCIYNREIFLKIGRFGNYGVASDYEFHLRICMKNSLVLMQRDLVWWRQHEGQEINLHENKYLELNYKIHHDILNNSDCPFTEEKRKKTIINVNKNYARKIIINFLKLKIKKAIFIKKVTNIPVSSYFYALIPRRFRNKMI